MIAEAAEHVDAARSLVSKINDIILYPLITLLVGVALLVFLWGMFEFIYNSESDQGRETGKRHMLWGIIGLLVMISAYAILKIATATFGVSIPT